MPLVTLGIGTGTDLCSRPVSELNQAHSQNQRRSAHRGRNEEPFISDNATSRRPPFEGKSRSTNGTVIVVFPLMFKIECLQTNDFAVPEDIVLGPPKTAFASASGTRNGAKVFDSPHRSSLTSHDETQAKHDRHVVKDRHAKDGQKDIEQSRESRMGSNQNRRSLKDEIDPWSNIRQQRSSGPDDGEHSSRRNGDRDNEKDGQKGRDSKASRGFENNRYKGDREVDTDNGIRRSGLGRGRNQPSWYRDDARMEGGLEDQEAIKPREVRDKEKRGAKGPVRDWTRGVKADLDPEWMETPGSEDVNRIHTQEDFEKWKERMKSNNASKSDTSTEQQVVHDRTVSGSGTGAAKVKVDTPLVVDSSVDKFFGLWNQPRKVEAASEVSNGVQPVGTSVAAKVSKPSKFTGFFTAKPDTEAPKEKPSLPIFSSALDSSNEDKEGFQRILSLLGQQQQSQNRQSETSRIQQQRDAQLSPPLSVPRRAENNDLYSLFGSRSPPANPAPQERDGEFFLKLMQQPQQHRPDAAQGNFAERRGGAEAMPGNLPLTNLMISPGEAPQQTPSTQPTPGFFDDAPTRDKLNPGTERRIPPPGFFDPGLPRQPSASATQQPGFPAGIQRPPGLEQIPPIYTQHNQPPRQNMVPPPGFQAPGRGQNAFPPGLVPGERLQFGIPTNSRGIPPPGFMHPAPPGFPAPFGQEGVPYGAFGDGGHYGHGFGPGQQRR